MTDTEQLDSLLHDVASGSTDALSKLYMHTKVSVYAFALSLLKNPQDAEDVLQDTYIHIWNGAGGYQSHGKPMAWILTVAKNLCRKRLQTNSRTVSIGEFWESLPAHMSPDDRLTLDYCLKQLAEEERQIVVLHAVSGIKHREIASLLELPLSTVLSKYHRAIKKMRANL